MRLTVTQFVTLDGVSQGPGSATEDTSGSFALGGWLVPHMDDAFVRQTSEWLDLADGLLLGRRTYEAFARDWPQITDPQDPFTERMNTLPKYVASTTLQYGAWQPTTVLNGDIVQELEALKRRPGRELQVHGSSRLAHTLLGAGVVDALRLAVAPVIIGTGRRLLSEQARPTGLQLVRSAITPHGVLLLEYEKTGGAATAEYAGVTGLGRDPA